MRLPHSSGRVLLSVATQPRSVFEQNRLSKSSTYTFDDFSQGLPALSILRAVDEPRTPGTHTQGYGTKELLVPLHGGCRQVAPHCRCALRLAAEQTSKRAKYISMPQKDVELPPRLFAFSGFRVFAGVSLPIPATSFGQIMFAYRRTSTLAARALARNCQGAAAVGWKAGAQARADFGASIGSRCLFSSLPEHIVVGMPGIVCF